MNTDDETVVEIDEPEIGNGAFREQQRLAFEAAHIFTCNCRPRELRAESRGLECLCGKRVVRRREAA
jgi:hypothetical protein